VKLTVIERVMKKVDKEGALPEGRPDLGACWVWTGRLNRDGYGEVRVDGQYRMTHRIVYQHLACEVPAGLELDHLCRVRHCVNPAHLEPVTHRENSLRSESFAAKNAVKTHCPQGHPYDARNTYAWRGSRICRACVRAAGRRYRARRKAAL